MFATIRNLLLSALLAACATKAPAPLPARLGLLLSPADLGQSISLQQHLKVERNGRIEELDAALEVDDGHLQLVGLAFGQRVLSLDYDGKKLDSWRHVMLPQQVHAEDVLEDIQLTLWPLAVIRAALPPGWRIEDSALRRELFLDDQLVCLVDYTSMPRWTGTVRLENLRFHYVLVIQSLPNNS